jgi:hypothetical protein
MGYAKLVKVSDRKVRLLHQLGADGQPYAEDVTIELAENVDPSRMAYLTEQDGKVGIASFSFRPEAGAPEDLSFPEE